MSKKEELAKKGKGFLREFTDFVLKGNVMDMAVGVIIIKYGDFITAVINFLIMAFVLFLLLKAFNKIVDAGKKRLVKEKEEETKKSDEVVLLEEIRDLLKKQK